MTETTTYETRTFRFPWKDVCRPLSVEERDRLRESIAARGVQNPVIVDEADNVIDGRHRLLIAQELGVRLEMVPFALCDSGLTDAEKARLAEDLNAARRQLSPFEIYRLAAQRRERVAAAREQGQSFRAIAESEGVSVSTVHDDIEKASGVRGRTPEAEAGKVVGRDGKEYPASRSFEDDGPTLGRRIDRVVGDLHEIFSDAGGLGQKEFAVMLEAVQAYKARVIAERAGQSKSGRGAPSQR